MKRFAIAAVSLICATMAIGALSPIAAQGPKNFVSPTYRFPADQPAAPHEMTKREANRLAATAELPADHLRLTRFYSDEADQLDAQAVAYEEAASSLRNGPAVKNLVAPGTPARYEFTAERLRGESVSDRKLAAIHERKADVERVP